MKNKAQTFITRAIVAAVIAYAVGVAGLLAFQLRLILPGGGTDIRDCPALNAVGLKLEHIPSTTLGEIRVFRPDDKIERRGTIVVLHGNSGTACDRNHYAEGLKDLGFRWVFLEYPGYGHAKGETGKVSVEGVLAHALEIVRLEKEMRPSTPLFVLGESIGTGIATYVASRIPDLTGLILQTPYTNIFDIGARRFPLVPVKFLLRYNLPADEWATSVRIPVLAYHSVDDKVIPIEIGRKQRDHFAPGNVQWHEFENAGHLSFRQKYGEDYWTLVRHFIQKNMGEGSSQ